MSAVASILRVHISAAGYGDSTGDWVVTLCGRTETMESHLLAWERVADNVACSACLAVYDENRLKSSR